MAKTRSNENGKIDPKKYARILRGIELEDVYLESCTVKHKRENFDKHGGLQVSIRDSSTYAQQDTKLVVSQKYSLIAKPPKMQRDFALKISAIFRLIYVVDFPIEKDFFEVFGKVNLPLNSWPYFREFVQNMTQRMNIPPLTLPLVRRA